MTSSIVRRRLVPIITVVVTLLVVAALSLANTLFFSTRPVLARDRTVSGASSWVGMWAASQQVATKVLLPIFPTDLAPGGFDNQTVRNIIFTSMGGREVRIRLSNTFGDRAVTIGQATVAVELSGATLVPGTTWPVTFSRHTSVTIPVGHEVVSDPVPFHVLPLENLAVSLYLSKKTGPATHHADARQINYVAAGDHAGDAAATAFTTQTQSWYFLDAVDVLTSNSPDGAIVAVGDSITDGYNSQVNANERWPNQLAHRLVAEFGNRAPDVLDAGISGNRVLNPSVCFGQSLLVRLDRDVLSQTGIRAVILLEGINDIGFSQTPNTGCSVPNTNVSAQQIIQGYEQVIARVHAHGLKIFGATLTPFKGAAYWSSAGEAKREVVNNWIRTSGSFDGTFDFAQATANPYDALVFNPGYDSGDHLHPNDAGYQAMGNAIDLNVLLGAKKR